MMSMRHVPVVIVLAVACCESLPARAQCQFEWQQIGSGLNQVPYALTVSDGSLIAGGALPGDAVMRWGGQAWQPLGQPFSGPIHALTTFNNELIAAGSFDQSGPVLKNIARWNGAAWQNVGFLNNTVYSLWPGYNGNLIAGGVFTADGNGGIRRAIARWLGPSLPLNWGPLGAGLTGDFGSPGKVIAIATYDDKLIAGGDFTTAPGFPSVTVLRIAQLAGSNWQPLGTGMNAEVRCLAVYGGALIAGGTFTTAGGVSANRIARWTGTAWEPMGSGMNGVVNALAVYNGELIAGGGFGTADGVTCNHIASWNGSIWQPLGTGMNQAVTALCVFNGELVAGGTFTTAGGAQALHLARWRCSQPVDTDGDGLLDDWEITGVPYTKSDGSTGLYVLPDASPYRKDIFVEVDSMPGRALSLAALTRVLSAFDTAPIAAPNVPGGMPGIALHIVLDETIPLRDYPGAFVEFQQDKATYFGANNTSERLNSEWAAMRVAKAKAFRYCICGNSHGESDSSGLAETPGNDFMVTLGLWIPPGGTEEQQAGTFMHELGHTLGLLHGGDQIDPYLPDNPLRYNYKPNYFSVMNYLWQVPQPWLPNGENIGQWGHYFPNYSEAAFPDLNEGALSEINGIQGTPMEVWVPYSIPAQSVNCETGAACGTPPSDECTRYARLSGCVDWNNDCNPRSFAITAVDINDLEGSVFPTPGDTLTGYSDWENLIYSFIGYPAFADGAVSTDNPIEMDFDTYQSLQSLRPPPGASGDANCDGKVDGLDIEPFILALINQSSYTAQNPHCNILESDMNADGTVNEPDVSLFVNKLLSR